MVIKGEKFDKVITETKLSVPLFIRGKVRDTYDLGKYLLIIATDRISAFDVVLPNGIPGKGAVLNQISAFWFSRTKDIIPNHVIEPIFNVLKLNNYVTLGKSKHFPDYLIGRSMVVKKAKRIPIECVVRGYLAGSGWTEYQKSSTICGISLPGGLKESEELPEPIFTPTTKADSGHDMPLTNSETEKLIGYEITNEIKETSLAIYKSAREYARGVGIIIADTKMEFGIDENEKLIIIDELLTPDSSRFWDLESYKVGKSQESYDKQPVRDWLINSGWNKEPPAPILPPEVIKSTTDRYKKAFEKLTGKKLQ
jgi:phosphoribosylaminoimidazole-succinocarboxamide synthase